MLALQKQKCVTTLAFLQLFEPVKYKRIAKNNAYIIAFKVFLFSNHFLTYLWIEAQKITTRKNCKFYNNSLSLRVKHVLNFLKFTHDFIKCPGKFWQKIPVAFKPVQEELKGSKIW